MNITLGKLTDQELITIVRHYGVPEEPCTDMNILIATAHEQFKRTLFENFDRLISCCVYEDREQ